MSVSTGQLVQLFLGSSILGGSIKITNANPVRKLGKANVQDKKVLPSISELSEREIKNTKKSIDYIQEMEDEIPYTNEDFQCAERLGLSAEECMEIRMGTRTSREIQSEYYGEEIDKRDDTIVASYLCHAPYDMYEEWSDVLNYTRWEEFRSGCNNIISCIGELNDARNETTICKFDLDECEDTAMNLTLANVDLNESLETLNIDFVYKESLLQNTTDRLINCTFNLNAIQGTLEGVQEELEGVDENLEGVQGSLRSCLDQLNTTEIELSRNINKLSESRLALERCASDSNINGTALIELMKENNALKLRIEGCENPDDDKNGFRKTLEEISLPLALAFGCVLIAIILIGSGCLAKKFCKSRQVVKITDNDLTKAPEGTYQPIETKTIETKTIETETIETESMETDI